MWRLELLGTARVLDENKQAVAMPRSAALVLLAFLATQNKPITREKIERRLCPNGYRDQANFPLRVALHTVNNILPGENEQAPILKTGDTLWLNRKVFQCDLWSFQESIAASHHEPDTEKCVLLLKEAVGLYDAFFPLDEKSNWRVSMRKQLEGEFLSALDRLILLLTSLERWPEALRYVELHLTYQPHSQRLLLQKEHVRHNILGGENFASRDLLVWNKTLTSQAERRNQFQTLMTALEKRGERPDLFTSEERILDAAVLWCAETLPQEPLQLAQWLAVLPSPVFQEDAVALFDLSESAFKERCSLLVAQRLVAFRSDALCMSQSIKERLLKTVSREEVSRLQAKHARYFTSRAIEWITRSPLPAPERNRWNEDNLSHLCQALDWTIAHLPEETERLFPLLRLVEDFLSTHPTLPRLYHFTDRILERIDQIPTSYQFKLSAYIASQMCRFQYRDKIKRPMEKAMRLLSEMDAAEADPQWAGELVALGQALHHAGGAGLAAERVLRAALSHYEKNQKWSEMGLVYFELSECLWAKGRLRQAQGCLEQSLFFLEQAGAAKTETAIPLMNLGALALTLGATEQAEASLNEALNSFAENYSLAIADTLAYLGAVETQRGHFKHAETLLNKSKAECDLLKQHANGMRATLFLGDNARARGQYERAEAYYQEALRFWREHGSVGWVVISLSKLAEISLATERDEQAQAYAEEILRLCRGTVGLSSRASAFYVKGILASKRGETKEAQLCFKKAEALRQFLGIPMDFLPQQGQSLSSSPQ